MKFSEYQELASRTEKTLPRAGALQHGILGCASEVGELADAVKKHVIYSEELDVANVAEEIGDVMWYLALLANNLGLNMDDIANSNIEKLRLRYPEKYTDGAAVARADKVGETVVVPLPAQPLEKPPVVYDGILQEVSFGLASSGIKAFGKIYGDSKGRFADGSDIFTSNIVGIITRNSTYKIGTPT